MSVPLQAGVPRSAVSPGWMPRLGSSDARGSGCSSFNPLASHNTMNSTGNLNATCEGDQHLHEDQGAASSSEPLIRLPTSMAQFNQQQTQSRQGGPPTAQPPPGYAYGYQNPAAVSGGGRRPYQTVRGGSLNAPVGTAPNTAPTNSAPSYQYAHLHHVAAPRQFEHAPQGGPDPAHHQAGGAPHQLAQQHAHQHAYAQNNPGSPTTAIEQAYFDNRTISDVERVDIHKLLEREKARKATAGAGTGGNPRTNTNTNNHSNSCASSSFVQPPPAAGATPSSSSTGGRLHYSGVINHPSSSRQLPVSAAPEQDPNGSEIVLEARPGDTSEYRSTSLLDRFGVSQMSASNLHGHVSERDASQLWAGPPAPDVQRDHEDRDHDPVEQQEGSGASATTTSKLKRTSSQTEVLGRPVFHERPANRLSIESSPGEPMNMSTIRAKLNRIYELVGKQENRLSCLSDAGPGLGLRRQQPPGSTVTELPPSMLNDYTAGEGGTPRHPQEQLVDLRAGGTSSCYPVMQVQAGGSSSSTGGGGERQSQSNSKQASPSSGPPSGSAGGGRRERRPHQTISDDLHASQNGPLCGATPDAALHTPITVSDARAHPGSSAPGSEATDLGTQLRTQRLRRGREGDEDEEYSPSRKHLEFNPNEISPIPNEYSKLVESGQKELREVFAEDEPTPGTAKEQSSLHFPVVEGLKFAKVGKKPPSPSSRRRYHGQQPRALEPRVLDRVSNHGRNCAGTSGPKPAKQESTSDDFLHRKIAFLQKYAALSDSALVLECRKAGILKSLASRVEMMEALEGKLLLPQVRADVPPSAPAGAAPSRLPGATSQSIPQPRGERDNSELLARPTTAPPKKRPGQPDPVPGAVSDDGPSSRQPQEGHQKANARAPPAPPASSSSSSNTTSGAAGRAPSAEAAGAQVRPIIPEQQQPPTGSSPPGDRFDEHTFHVLRDCFAQFSTSCAPDEDPPDIQEQQRLVLHREDAVACCVRVHEAVAEEVARCDFAEESVQLRFARFDYDGDDLIDFEEFRALCALLVVEAEPEPELELDLDPWTHSSDVRYEPLPAPDPNWEVLFPVSYRRWRCLDRETEQTYSAVKVCKTQLSLPQNLVRKELRKLNRAAKRNKNLLPFSHMHECTYGYYLLRKHAGVELPVFWTRVLPNLGGGFEGWLVGIMKQLLKAVAFLHQEKLVHGNICPSVVIVDEADQHSNPMGSGSGSGGGASSCTRERDGNQERPAAPAVALAETGLAALFRHQELWALGPPLDFTCEAPEYDSCGSFDPGAKADVWSLGAVFFQLLTGCAVPFNLETRAMDMEGELGAQGETLAKKAGHDPSFARLAADLCGRMLATDPALRPTARQCLQQCLGITQQLAGIPTSPSRGQARNLQTLLQAWALLGDGEVRLRGAVRAIAWELQFPLPVESVEAVRGFEDLEGAGLLSPETVDAVRSMLPENFSTDPGLLRHVVGAALTIKLNELDEVLSSLFSEVSPYEELGVAALLGRLDAIEAEDLDQVRFALSQVLSSSVAQDEEFTTYQNLRSHMCGENPAGEGEAG